jgi:hypothetical protein
MCVCIVVTVCGTEMGSSCQDEAVYVYCRTVSLNLSLQSVIFLRNLFGILPKQKGEETGENV